jgi:serine/threonine protein kinase
MKVIKKSAAQESNNILRFQQERDILASIEHPFIVRLHCTFQTSLHLFIGMQYCPGGDMSELLDDYGYLSEEETRIYVAQILLAFETLHSRGIVYRDLKPQNVVIDQEGNAMLTDFGLGKKCMPNRKLNSFCGTAAYLAPEMIQKRGHDTSIDWYLLGVFMYELLVGLPPYFDHEKEIMFENIKRGPLKLPRTLSKEARDLILKVLSSIYFSY